MLPDGVSYYASWIDAADMRCFQVMETSDPALLAAWCSRWNDLVDFEVVLVQTSAEFWAQANVT